MLRNMVTNLGGVGGGVEPPFDQFGAFGQLVTNNQLVSVKRSSSSPFNLDIIVLNHEEALCINLAA